MRMRYYMPVILLLAIVAFLITIINLQYFNITKMVFNGNIKYADSMLLKDTTIDKQENGFKQLFESGGKIYMFRFSKEEEYLKRTFPYIKNIIITYKLPNTVTYDIQERKPVFYTQYLGTYLILDKEGNVLEVVQKEPNKDLILLSGISFSSFTIGKKLELENNETLSYAYESYTVIIKNDNKKAYRENFLPLIRECNFADKRNMYVNINNDIIAIIPLNKNIEYCIGSLQGIYFKNVKNKGKGILDFSGKNPIFTPYFGEVKIPLGN